MSMKNFRIIFDPFKINMSESDFNQIKKLLEEEIDSCPFCHNQLSIDFTNTKTCGKKWTLSCSNEKCYSININSKNVEGLIHIFNKVIESYNVLLSCKLL